MPRTNAPLPVKWDAPSAFTVAKTVWLKPTSLKFTNSIDYKKIITQKKTNHKQTHIHPKHAARKIIFTYRPYIKTDYNLAMNYINQINSSNWQVFIQVIGIYKIKAHKSGHVCEIILYYILPALGIISWVLLRTQIRS